MLPDVQEFVRGKRVAAATLVDESEIEVRFDGTETVLRLTVMGDCCNDVWFELHNNVSFDTMLGREIADIEQDPQPLDLPPSGRQDCDDNWLVHVTFVDGTVFDFVWRNSSNGYYPGSFGMGLVSVASPA